MRGKLTAVLLSGVLLSACNLTGIGTLEENVDTYNGTLVTMKQTYYDNLDKLEYEKEIVDALLNNKTLPYLEEGVEMKTLDKEVVSDFKAYTVTDNNLYTTTNYKGITHVLKVRGYSSVLLIEVIWLDNKIVFLDTRIKET